MATAPYGIADSPLRSPTVWSIEAGDLVRRSGASEAHWPLAGLTRMTLLRQPNRYGPDVRVARLRFGRRKVAIASQGWEGVGRRIDQTVAFCAFVRALAAEAAAAAPSARFQAGRRPQAAAGIYWIAALLGAALLAMAAVAVSARQFGLGLDFGSRLLFLLILLLAAAPWLPGPAAGDFDPRSVPDDLAPRP